MNHLVNFRGFRYFLKSCQLFLALEVHSGIRVICQGSDPYSTPHFAWGAPSGVGPGCAVVWLGRVRGCSSQQLQTASAQRRARLRLSLAPGCRKMNAATVSF